MSPEVFERALNNYVDELQKAGHAKGAVISGSYVTGQLGPYSDLDLYVLVAEGCPSETGWQAIDRDGVEIEVTAHTYPEYIEFIGQGSRVREIIYPLSVGHILFDSQGQFEHLLVSARACI